MKKKRVPLSQKGTAFRPLYVKRLDDIFTERFMPLYPKLYYVAAAILGTASGEAADAVQEAMVKIWKSGEKMASIDNPESYAIAILRTTAIDVMRRRRFSDSLDCVPETVADPPPDPDSAAFLERIISTLPATQQEVIRLSAFDDLSNDEIAAITGHTAANVRQLLSRGRKKIKELYSKHMQP